MPAAQPKPRFEPVRAPSSSISPAESARYTGDLLESLRKMAIVQGHNLLAHLLELARFEAITLVKDETKR